MKKMFLPYILSFDKVQDHTSIQVHLGNQIEHILYQDPIEARIHSVRNLW